MRCGDQFGDRRSPAMRPTLYRGPPSVILPYFIMISPIAFSISPRICSVRGDSACPPIIPIMPPLFIPPLPIIPLIMGHIPPCMGIWWPGGGVPGCGALCCATAAAAVMTTVAISTRPITRFMDSSHTESFFADGDAALEGGPTRRSPWRATGRPAEASDLRQLARLDQFNQHVPLVFLQDREVPGFTDAHLVALHGDFRAVDARWAERHLQAVHFVSSLSSTGWRVRCVGTRPLRPSLFLASHSAGRVGHSGRS